jgi:hypothetical protein
MRQKIYGFLKVPTETFILTTLIAGCAGAPAVQFGTSPAATNSPIAGQPPITSTTDDPPICDLNHQPPPTLENGLKGKLGLVPSEITDLTNINLSTFWTSASLDDDPVATSSVAASIYFTDLNVPARAFSEGFLFRNGAALADPRDPSGNTILTEYFSLKFQGRIKVPASLAGQYYFALISDDGSVMDISQNDHYSRLIDNDGNHPQKMGCPQAANLVNLAADEELPFRILYYQGPRLHIALQLVWKKVNSALSNPIDPLCGVTANNLFQDSTQPNSPPTANWNALVSRGWSVVPPEVIFLPEGQTNQCL